MGKVESALEALGLELPAPKVPVANYLGTKKSGKLLFVSGRVSQTRGEVGTELDTAEAKLAARDAMLNVLAIVKQDIGDLDRIESVEKLNGFVRSSPSYTEQPFVVDGASELLIGVFGEADIAFDLAALAVADTRLAPGTAAGARAIDRNRAHGDDANDHQARPVEP